MDLHPSSSAQLYLTGTACVKGEAGAQATAPCGCQQSGGPFLKAEHWGT